MISRSSYLASALLAVLVSLIQTSATAQLVTTPYFIEFAQRDGAGANASRGVVGSSYPWRAMGFNATGVFGPITLFEMLPSGTAGQVLRRNALNNGVEFWTPGDASDGDKGDITVSGGTWSVDPSAISGTKIADGAVGTAKLADAAVTGAKIAAATIANANVAAGAGIQFTKLEAVPATAASPTFTGVVTNSGGALETPYDMPALAVNIDRVLNRKTDNASRTITFEGTPTAGKWFRIHWTNTAVTEVIITLPAGILNGASNTAVANFTVSAASGGNNGQRSVYFEYTGTAWLAHLGGGGGDADSVDWTNITNKPDLQPLDTDLTNIAALSTTPYGRSLLTRGGPASFTGTGTYAAGGTYSGNMIGPATLTMSLAGGEIAVFMLNASGGPHTLTHPSARVSGTTGSSTTTTSIPDGFQIVSFYSDGTNLWVMPDIYRLVAIATDVSGLGTGVATFLGTASSANLRSAVTDEAGTGPLMFTRTGVRRTFYVSGGAMTPRTTNGAARATVELATNDIMLEVCDFDQTTEEGVGFWMTMPATWDAGTITAKFHWTAAAGSAAETVAWNIAARGLPDDAAIDQALGTEQAASDALLATGDMHVSATTPAITVGGTAAAGTPTYFQVTRDVAADNLAGDARLIGVTIEYTESVTEPSAQ